MQTDPISKTFCSLLDKIQRTQYYVSCLFILHESHFIYTLGARGKSYFDKGAGMCQQYLHLSLAYTTSIRILNEVTYHTVAVGENHRGGTVPQESDVIRSIALAEKGTAMRS
jgi:hypothetical protein